MRHLLANAIAFAVPETVANCRQARLLLPGNGVDEARVVVIGASAALLRHITQ